MVSSPSLGHVLPLLSESFILASAVPKKKITLRIMVLLLLKRDREASMRRFHRRSHAREVASLLPPPVMHLAAAGVGGERAARRAWVLSVPDGHKLGGK